MVVKIKKNVKSVILLSIFVMSCFSPMLVSGDTSPPTPDYSWQETNYQYTLNRVWTGDSNSINFTGAYTDTIVATFDDYNETDNTMIREARTTHYDGNYSVYSNKTIKGYVDTNMDLDVYRVDVEYGKDVQLIWIALKQGTLQMDYFLEQFEEDYSLVEEYNLEVESEFTKFNATTSEVIDRWSETYNSSGGLNMTMDGEPIDYHSYYSYDIEFSLPLVLVMQIYTTKNKDKIAWAETFYDYIVYKDKDQDGIYSAGETNSPPTSGFDLYSSNEMCGVVRPMAWDFQMYHENIDPISSVSTNFSTHQVLPFDRTVSDIASTIQFTPPTSDENDIISWDIEYPQFPVYASVSDSDKDPSEWYSTEVNATYDLMSPTDFNYQFDYNLSESQADFDFTLGLSKISNADLYDAVQGLGLSLPHYNFFVTSFDINEVDPTELTVPSDLFIFESNGLPVAKINMINPLKKNYTLYDYPQSGTNTTMESTGGSLHKLLTSDSEQSANSGNPFLNLVYSIEELVKADPDFTIADELYHLETQNYRLWNGEKLTHDPTLTIYYEDQKTEDGPPSGPDTLIPGFDLFIVIAFVSAVVVIQVINLKKRIKN